MSVFHNNALIGASGQAVGGYVIERSIRLNSADSAYLSRTPASAGNRKTWTWAGWVKRSSIGTAQNHIFVAGPATSSNATYIRLAFNADDTFFIGLWTTSIRTTSAVFRDPSAWYHIVVAMDTANATEADRCIIYVNGVRQTTSGTVTQNDEYGINAAQLHHIGNENNQRYFSGYLADVHFIDGQALTPSDFTETDATTGQLIPKAYTGTYGTNGFHLPFSDNSTAAALGTDTSGNSNTWTVNNISVAAGAGNDSLVDTPTSYGTDTGAGGEVRGNYCAINSIAPTGGASFSEGNLQAVTPVDNNGIHIATLGLTSGKWYWESTIVVGTRAVFGITTSDYSIASGGAGVLGAQPGGYGYASQTGDKYNNDTASAYGNTFTTGDIIGIAFDATAGSLYFYKNGVIQNSGTPAFTGLTSGPYFPAACDSLTSAAVTIVHNFGQRPFAYTAPSGYKALCTTNLPAPVVAQPSTVMDVKLWTGTGSTQTISGFGFSPDLVWIKSRSNTASHALLDTVRGASLVLRSEITAAETNNTSVFTSFNSDGFTLGADTSNGWTNFSTWTYAGWCWDAGSSTVTLNPGDPGAGSITSSVRANASAGFSIVTYTGTGANATIGHGLGVQPSMVVVKNRSATGDWVVYHRGITNSETGAVFWNLTNAFGANSTYWNNTAPSSSVFSVGTYLSINTNTYVAYCFAPVEGYSAFGSYTGNGSTDGPFVYTGFRPRWILIKSSSLSATDWCIFDSARDGFNANNDGLLANASAAENFSVLSTDLDIVSNGFKPRFARDMLNQSGVTYLYCAFAEHPFQYARAR